MQPGALRALEWDQIVDVVRGFALTPPGAARLADLAPQSDPHRAAQLLTATAEGVKYLDANPAFSLNAPADLDTVLAALAVEGRALDPLRLLAFAEFLDSLALTCATIRRVTGSFPDTEGARGKLRIVQEPDRRGTQQDRSVWRGERQRQPRAVATAHAAAEAAIAPALDARIVSSRQGHVALSAGPGRQRPRRPLRARRQGGASRIHSRHHPRQLRQRREPLSRAAQHGRDQQRDRGARAAGARRGAPHPAPPHRCVPAQAD